MRYIRTCVVMICVISAACFLSYNANQKSSKKEKVRQEKTTHLEWKKECAKKISAESPPGWMMDRIKMDLSACALSKVTSEMLDSTMRQAKQNWHLARFRIQDNQLKLVDSDNVFHPKMEQMVPILQTLTELAYLPNMDFIISLSDEIQRIDAPAPILAFAKSEDSHKIVLIPDNVSMLSQENIKESDMYHYLYLVLTEYAKLQSD
jgi:hypothetical protein